MKKFLLLALLLLAAVPAIAAPLIKVVAMVNNDAVTSYQLEKKLASAMAADTGSTQLSMEEHQALKLKILNAMIEDLLVEQRIRTLGLKVSNEEVDRAIEDVQLQNKLTSEQLKNALKAQGVSFADYRQNLRKEILRYKLISREVRSKIEVTRAQIREYFNSHEKDYEQPPTLRLGRISYPLTKETSEADKEILRQKAQVLRQKLLGGTPFSELLTELEPEADGGDMGTMVEEEMNAKLRKAVVDLKVGEVSEPEEALGSIHLFQVLERTPARAELNDETRQEIEKILAKQNSDKRFAEWKKELRKDAIIDIRI